MIAPQLAIGIDIGGTKIAGGLIDVHTGRVVHRRQVPTNSNRIPRAVFEDIWRMQSDLHAEADQDSHIEIPVGIGVPELVDPRGTIRSSHVLDWSGWELEARVASIPGYIIESDVRAAALAESRFGAGRGATTFFYISIGTGISSCLVLNGRPFTGHRGNALVLASSDRDGLNPERIASGPGIAARYSALSGRTLTQSEDVVAQSTDLIAFEVVEAATNTIAVNIALAIDILDPERVVLGGGLGSAPGMYRDALIPAIRSRIWSEETRELPIVPAELGADAGIIGAAVKAVSAAKESILEGTAT